MALWRRLAAVRSSEVRLRAFRKSDLPALLALDQLCFAEEIAYSADELKGFLQHPSAFSVVACASSRIVGFAIVRSTRRAGPDDKSRSALHILTIDVDPEMRRQGVGAALMEWMIGKAREVRASVLVLEVAVDNQPAQAFYQRFGFQVANTIPGYYNGTTDAFALERRLDKP